MAHLASFREGWRSENLASYLLSRFSFLAKPSTVSDDIGSDYFCTLFKRVIEERHEYLSPLNSFAIQIKSNRQKIDASNKIEYLQNLELPFFIGVVTQKDLSLTIYSGEALPLLFSHYGTPNSLIIELIDTPPKNIEKYYSKKKESYYIIRFPCLGKVDINMTQSDIDNFTNELSKICKTIHRTIASKSNGEYIFDLTRITPPQVLIFAGSGSARVFRENFLRRLAEVFHNLEWEYRHKPEELISSEFLIFEGLLAALRDEYGTLPEYLKKAYRTAKNTIKYQQYDDDPINGGVSLRSDPVSESIVTRINTLTPKKRDEVLTYINRISEYQE